jgi:hypothetical protein
MSANDPRAQELSDLSAPTRSGDHFGPGVVHSASMWFVLLVVGAVIEILAWMGIMVMRRKARLEGHCR